MASTREQERGAELLVRLVREAGVGVCFALYSEPGDGVYRTVSVTL